MGVRRVITSGPTLGPICLTEHFHCLLDYFGKKYEVRPRIDSASVSFHNVANYVSIAESYFYELEIASFILIV